MADRVIFRVLEDEVIALLPDNLASWGYIDSYMHMGQHGEADPGLPGRTRLATEAEYLPLLRELEGIGYKLRICKRLTRPFGGWAD